MKIHITGAEFDESESTYKIRYHDQIVAETTDRWRAIATCLSKDTLDQLLKNKQSEALYNNSSI